MRHGGVMGSRRERAWARGNRTGTGLILLIGLLWAGTLPGCASLNGYQFTGQTDLAGLTHPARVLRDENGMAYIYADDLKNAFLVMGFVTNLVFLTKKSKMVGKWKSPINGCNMVILGKLPVQKVRK